MTRCMLIYRGRVLRNRASSVVTRAKLITGYLIFITTTESDSRFSQFAFRCFMTLLVQQTVQTSEIIVLWDNNK
jgi:hypothetical protein